MRPIKVFIIIALISILGSCHKTEPRKPVSYKSGSFLDESLKRNVALLRSEEDAIFDIIQKDSLNTYLNSSDGFWYHYVQQNKNDTVTPQFGDKLIFTYNLRTFSEDTIYSITEIGDKTYIMDQQRLMTGLREGLKLMKEGEKVNFLFPSSRAYGFYGDKNRIGSDTPLKATVKLKKIIKTEK